MDRNRMLAFWMGVACVGALASAQLDEDAREAWGKAADPVRDVLDLEETRDDLPESRWLTRDQRDLDREINKLLDEAAEVLRVNGLTEAREGYRDLERRLRARREELRDLREKAAMAPEDISVLEFYRKDRESFRKEAEAVEEEIRNLQGLQEELVDEMVAAARGMDIPMTREQIRFTLGSVSGSDLMDLGALFQNIRSLNTMLEDLVRENPDDPEAARRYYGMHVILMRTLVRAHDRVVERIDDRYLPRIEELRAENETLIRETERMLRFAEEAHRELLLSTRDTQRVTREALEMYREHLRSVRDRVYAARKQLQQRTDVAWNAYRTIRVAATLAGVMADSVKDLNTLRDLQLPTLRPIDDQALRGKFLELTEQLQE